MKKKNIINLIKYHVEHNEHAFREEAYEIARYFDDKGDSEIASYIMALLADVNVLYPQINKEDNSYFNSVDISTTSLYLPDIIIDELTGIVNAVSHNIGINKFLFKGSPGTGKTEATKHLARILKRDLFSVDFSSIIDSKLGETQKNISNLFEEINTFARPNKVMVLFDEIDALVMDRTNNHDIREMGRATSSFLKGLDSLNNQVVLVATTNLYEYFDKAILRRFDYIIDFNKYTTDDLLDIAEKIMDLYLAKFKIANRDVRLFRKIILLQKPIPYPGELINIIKSSIAFSDMNDKLDYFRRLYLTIVGKHADDIFELYGQGFSIREIEVLTKKSKSAVARELKERDNNE